MYNQFEQVRPAPQFEREAPDTRVEPPGLPDLDALARELQQMKIDAMVDAERTRPGLNGFLAFVVVAGATYIGEFVAQDGTGALDALTHTQPLNDPTKVIAAGGAGLIVAGVAGVLSFLATRRTQRTVQTFEHKLVSLGGAPLPDQREAN